MTKYNQLTLLLYVVKTQLDDIDVAYDTELEEQNLAHLKCCDLTLYEVGKREFQERIEAECEAELEAIDYRGKDHETLSIVEEIERRLT